MHIKDHMFLKATETCTTLVFPYKDHFNARSPKAEGNQFREEKEGKMDKKRGWLSATPLRIQYTFRFHFFTGGTGMSYLSPAAKCTSLSAKNFH
ncbi:hypothetical protein GSbR_32640 [Geobacter sp. SVR]|nr:hypothetical protein GSVR_11060 [Geobacter sp. SVR]GCF86664.1 hypothetical protein GSbR_32640 [Geobacter sp. SVR]